VIHPVKLVKPTASSVLPVRTSYLTRPALTLVQMAITTQLPTEHKPVFLVTPLVSLVRKLQPIASVVLAIKFCLILLVFIVIRIAILVLMIRRFAPVAIVVLLICSIPHVIPIVQVNNINYIS
jgi:hypothetical protein